MKAEKAELRIIDKIVRLAKSRGWTQGDIEEKLGLAHGRLTKWLKPNGTDPGASFVWAASKLLSVDVTYLLDPKADEPRLAARDDYQVCTEIMHGLGPEESFRRLTLKEDPRRSEEDGMPPYVHGQRVPDESLRRRRHG